MVSLVTRAIRTCKFVYTCELPHTCGFAPKKDCIIKQNHMKIYMFGVVGEMHAHDSFEVILFDNSKDI